MFDSLLRLYILIPGGGHHADRLQYSAVGVFVFVKVNKMVAAMVTVILTDDCK